MKRIPVVIVLLGLVLAPLLVSAQAPAGGPNPAAAAEPTLSADQLDTLVAPIALYPDPMIAMILPASTVPSDVVLAARYLRNGKDVNQIDNQNWDPSVKSLARYPDVINMMDENLDWTNQLGAAVISQQADVMQAIQTQRAKANALGNLTTTPQQQVIVQKEIIQIVPADPQIIYIPQYNPQVVYVQPAPPLAPFITFGIGFAMGAWLTNDCDWHHHGFYVNNWGRSGWHGYSYNNNVNININNNNNYWRPNSNRPAPRPPYNPNRPGGGSSGNLPSFRPPPSGGWGGNGGNRPGSGGNNRPGGSKPGHGDNNRPGGGNGDNRPGSGVGNNRPGGGGATKPGASRPETLPAGGKNKLPSAEKQRPNAGKPQAKPSNPGGQNNRPNREASKQRPANTQQARPTQKQSAQRPAAAQKQAPQRQRAAR